MVNDASVRLGAQISLYILFSIILDINPKVGLPDHVVIQEAIVLCSIARRSFHINICSRESFQFFAHLCLLLVLEDFALRV